MGLTEQGLPITHLLRDRDGKFAGLFDTILKAQDAEVVKLPPRSPNLNAYAERWVQSIQTECLDHFIVCGEDHLTHIAKEYVEHYNTERPHQGKDNEPLAKLPPPNPDGQIMCKERVGGLLKHYYRKAA